MKKILLGLFLLLFSGLSYGQTAIDSLSTIDQFGRVRDGIIAQNIIDVLNTDPSGVKLTENEKQYIRTIVNGLYTTGVWQKCKAVYGFVGGNEWKHKWNWKDMRDLDVAFRLVFFNSPTHSSNGVAFDGVDDYADTFINPSVNITTPQNSSIFVYLNDLGSTTSTIPSLVGCANTITGGSMTLAYRNGLNGSSSFLKRYSATNSTSIDFVTNSDTSTPLGFVLGNLQTSNNYLLVNQIFLSTITGSLDNAIVNQKISIGQAFGSSLPSFANFRTPLIGIADSGFSQTQAIQTSNIVTFAQSILNRQ